MQARLNSHMLGNRPVCLLLMSLNHFQMWTAKTAG